MTETNALAEGAASTSSEQTENAQSSAEATPNAQTQPEAVEGAEPEVAASKEGEQASETEGKKQARTASARIDQLKRERDEAEIRAYAAEQKLRGLKRPIAAKDNMTEVQRSAVELRNADRELEAQEVSSTVDEARAEMRNARFELFSEKVGDAKIVEAFCKLPRVSEELADLVAESDMAAELAAKLSNSPQEARRLSALPPHRLGAELARMETSLSKAPAVRRVSQAPEPGSTLKGGSNPTRKSAGEMPYREYEKMRQKQMEADGR